MKAFSFRKAWPLFAASIAVLASLAYMGDLSASRYAASESSLSHMREVELQVALLRSRMEAASALRFQVLADPEAVSHYARTMDLLEVRFAELQRLTEDNEAQQADLAKLRPLLGEWKRLLAENTPHASSSGVAALPETAVQQEDTVSASIGTILNDMQKHEENLVTSGTIVSQQNYRRLRLELAVGFLAGLIALVISFRALLVQLRMRATAESSVRKLNAHILSAQDVERRRLARELHDGLGQIFAGLVMDLDMLAKKADANEEVQSIVSSAREIAAQGAAETRTISYLLHPPMLDELGFEHALKWYVDGFIKRSRIDVSLEFPERFQRLPDSISLVLFRVIQESLTNVHRHSGSARAKIIVTRTPDRVDVGVSDFGKGMSPERLKNIQESSSGAGVGLGGMRERVADLGGRFNLESGLTGTTVRVSLPLFGDEQWNAKQVRAASAHSSAEQLQNSGTSPSTALR